MAAAEELRCVDRFCHQVCFRRHRQHIHFERGTEKRDQGICRTKRCFCRPSYGIRYKFNVSAGPMVYLMVILRCSDWCWMYPIERRGIFFPGSVETRPIITAHWSGIRLIFWVCSNRLKMLPSFLPSSLVRKQVLLQMS